MPPKSSPILPSMQDGPTRCQPCQWSKMCSTKDPSNREPYDVRHSRRTMVKTSGVPTNDLVPSLLDLSDVMGTGWFAADAANVKPGSTVVVVGDGAVGLLGVLSAQQMGAERIIAMSRHDSRQKLATERRKDQSWQSSISSCPSTRLRRVIAPWMS